MNDVMSVDTTIEQILGHLAGYASLCWQPKPKGVFDPELATKGVDEAQAKLHSLLISKLPEKKLTNSAFEERRLSTPESVQNAAYNSAIDNMRKSIDELFGVDNG